MDDFLGWFIGAFVVVLLLLLGWVVYMGLTWEDDFKSDCLDQGGKYVVLGETQYCDIPGFDFGDD